MTQPYRPPASGLGAPVYNFFFHLVNDIRLTLTDFDQKAQECRYGLAIPPNDLKDRDVRILSIALRAFGCYSLLLAALLVNPIIGRHHIEEWPFTLCRLAVGALVATIANDCLVLGSKIVDALDLINQRPSRNPTSLSEKIGFAVDSTFNAVTYASEQIAKGDFPTIYSGHLREFVKGTLIVHDVYYYLEKVILETLETEAKSLLKEKFIRFLKLFSSTVPPLSRRGLSSVLGAAP